MSLCGRWLARGGGVLLAWVLIAWPGSAVAAGGWPVQSAQLSAVSCVSSRHCVVVGSHPNRSGREVTLVARWNGSNWQVQPSPNPNGATASFLGGVSCTSAKRCVAVGNSLDGGRQVTLAERWNGVKWSLVPTPNPQAHRTSKLTVVSCPSATFCAAVGTYTTQTDAQGLPLFETWNGTSWSIQSPPNGGAVELSDVSCTSATDCTAVGGSAWHWDGTRWSNEPTPKLGTEGGLHSISCTSPKACTAVGTSGNPNGYVANTLAERWNGTRWTIQSTPNKVDGDGSTNALSAVSCASASVCTAVGYWQQYCHPVECQGGLAERWNGTTWKIQHISAKVSPLLFNAVSCPTTTACTAVTGSGFGGGFYSTATWNGASWTT
jgi:hypothetical protein